MEESVKVLSNVIMKADPILHELVSKVKQFEKLAKMTTCEREKELMDKYGEHDYLD